MFIGLLFFILGLCIGSFINALEYRIEQEKSITGRSFCPNCKHKLVWYDLIPIFSWVYLRGKCRYCKKQISLQYPVVELITGLVFLLIGNTYGFTSSLPFLSINQGSFQLVRLLSFALVLVVSSILILVALYDLKTGYILSKYVYSAIFVTAIYLAINIKGGLSGFFNYIYPFLISGLIPAGIFFLLYYFSKEKWMGAGDVEIALLMGFLLGWPKILVAMYFAFIAGSIFGLTKIYLFKKAKFASELPFAPFLVAGTFFALFFGQQLFEIYVKIFLRA